MAPLDGIVETLQTVVAAADGVDRFQSVIRNDGLPEAPAFPVEQAALESLGRDIPATLQALSPFLIGTDDLDRAARLFVEWAALKGEAERALTVLAEFLDESSVDTVLAILRVGEWNQVWGAVEPVLIKWFQEARPGLRQRLIHRLIEAAEDPSVKDRFVRGALAGWLAQYGAPGSAEALTACRRWLESEDTVLRQGCAAGGSWPGMANDLIHAFRRCGIPDGIIFAWMPNNPDVDWLDWLVLNLFRIAPSVVTDLYETSASESKRWVILSRCIVQKRLDLPLRVLAGSESVYLRVATACLLKRVVELGMTGEANENRLVTVCSELLRSEAEIGVVQTVLDVCDVLALSMTAEGRRALYETLKWMAPRWSRTKGIEATVSRILNADDEPDTAEVRLVWRHERRWGWVKKLMGRRPRGIHKETAPLGR